MINLTDTIAAVSTPPGKGGVAIIRISGGEAASVAARVFTPASGKAVASLKPRTQTYGYITEDGERIDDVLLTLFPAPHSYTGEDTVEISCHGGILVTRTVLEAVLRAGARAAEAGEFTRRAFISGRLSLTEAEALGTLLEAESREQLRLCSEPARRRLSEKIGAIRESLLSAMSSVFARIDYPDEDLGELDDKELLSLLNNIKVEISSLISTYRTGRAIAEGVSTVIAGKPNAGKSSLYNLLLCEEAAIVTDIPGTTRDSLTRSVSLGRAMLRLTDTAGIRSQTADAVERIGIKKSLDLISNCQLLLAIFDLSRDFDDEDERLIEAIRESSAAKIAIFNKSDLPTRFDKEKVAGAFDSELTVSVKAGGDEAIVALTRLTEKLILDEGVVTTRDAILSSARQHATLTRALDFINLAVEALAMGYTQDAVASDIERALGAISELDGRAVSEEVTAHIFSRFCVGK